MSRRPLARPGFTLIEAIIAIVVLSIAAPPLLMALAATQTERAQTTRSIEATWIAADHLERVIRDRHAAGRGYDYITPANYPPAPSLPEAPGFGREIGIAETTPDLSSPGSGAKTVTVTVTWTEPMGGARSFALATVLTDLEE